jgi:hypothetical protein
MTTPVMTGHHYHLLSKKKKKFKDSEWKHLLKVILHKKKKSYFAQNLKTLYLFCYMMVFHFIFIFRPRVVENRKARGYWVHLLLLLYFFRIWFRCC